METVVTSTSWSFITLHHQRTDAFAVLADGTQCGVAVHGGRVLLVIGSSPFDLTTVLVHTEILGIRSLGSFVATLTNPVLLFSVRPHEAPVFCPTRMVSPPSPGSPPERMVNTVKLFYEGSELSLFVGTNGGFFSLIRLRNVEGNKQRYLKNICHSDDAVNDLDVRFIDANGLVHAVLVRDSSVISLYLVDLHVDCRHQDRVAGSDITGETCSVEATTLSEYRHPDMQGFFTYCAFSVDGRFVAATADADQLIVICAIDEQMSSMTLHRQIRTSGSVPYRIVPAVEGKFVCVCNCEVLLVDPAMHEVTKATAIVNAVVAGISDVSAHRFSACVSGTRLGANALVQAGPANLHSFEVEETSSGESSLRLLATTWLRNACAITQAPDLPAVDLPGTSSHEIVTTVQRTGVFACPCGADGKLVKKCFRFTPIPALAYTAACVSCISTIEAGEWVRHCSRCNAQYCMRCLPPRDSPR